MLTYTLNIDTGLMLLHSKANASLKELGVDLASLQASLEEDTQNNNPTDGILNPTKGF